MAQTKKELPALKKQSDIFKLVIPKEVEEKIRHLCRCVPTVEWSGKLFYKVEGSIADKDLVITCVDIYPMDIGSGTYTEFEETPDYFGYMVDKDLMDCNIGLIHSHNNMATFFSGTDTSTLQEEGNDNNHFVSLIVNNAGKYTAAVTSKVITTMKVVATDSYKTFDDSEVKIEGQRAWEQINETIEYYMLDIEKEEVPSVMNELDNRLNEIRVAKAKKEEERRKKSFDFSTRPASGIDYWGDYTGNKADNKSVFNNHSFLDRKDYKYPSLFRDEEFEDIVASEGQNLTEPVIVSEKVVNDFTAQLITGSVLISGQSDINLEKFATSMEALFTKRFGDIDYHYEYWIDTFLDYLIEETTPEGLEVEKENEFIFNLLSAVRDKVDKLDKNKCTKVIIELLDIKNEY